MCCFRYLLIICYFVCFQPSEAGITGTTAYKFNNKCRLIKKELLNDANRKRLSVSFLKESHEKNNAFQMSVQVAEIKVAYADIMKNFVKMEQLTNVDDQLQRTEHLAKIQRRATEILHLLNMVDEAERRKLRRSEKAQIYKDMLRSKDVAQKRIAEQALRKMALRTAMQDISKNDKDRAWPNANRRNFAANKQRQ